jgi:hypothetical protein
VLVVGAVVEVVDVVVVGSVVVVVDDDVVVSSPPPPPLPGSVGMVSSAAAGRDTLTVPSDAAANIATAAAASTAR